MRKKNETFLISYEWIIILLPYDYVYCNGLDTPSTYNDNLEIDRHDLTINNL